SKSLVGIDFLYSGFSKAFDPGRPGGHVEFRTMPNGVTLIDRWHLRMPSKEMRGPLFVGRRGLDGVVIQESGGELAHARWQDGTTWHASLGTVQMQLVTQSGAPDTGRTLVLDSTTYAA